MGVEEDESVIEFVCSANRSRSVIAELLANNYIRDNNIEHHIAKSSGIYADSMRRSYTQAEQIPLFFCQQLFSIAFERNRLRGDVFSESEIKELKPLIENIGNHDIEGHNLRTIQNYAYKAMVLFDGEEAMYRPQALQQLGILGCLKTEPEQTRIRGNAVLILGMKPHHVDFVKKIYFSQNAAKQIPIITTMMDYVYGLQDAPIEDGFGNGLEGYIKTITILGECVRKALDKYFLNCV